MSGFLPDDYKEPATSNYMTLKDGLNTFRVLSSAVTGWVYWVNSKSEDGKDIRKPIRVKSEQDVEWHLLGIDKWGKKEYPKFFWAFVVYNFEDMRIQILELAQRSVREQIEPLVKNKKWGDPKDYNIIINRFEDAGFTKYQVTPEPKEAIAPEITQLFQDMQINLEALFTGEDPFDSVAMDEKVEVTPEEADQIMNKDM